MSGFAVRMSAYKTVSERADLKRNFAASLARDGYTAGRKGAERGAGNGSGFWRNRRAREARTPREKKGKKVGKTEKTRGIEEAK